MNDGQRTMEIRRMAAADVDAAMRLSTDAGWNQTRADWLRLLTWQPGGCAVACCDDVVVGTVTTTAYGDQLGWIGMMLVDPQYRRRGIATALMKAAIDYLHKIDVACIKLDATPEGELVYRRLGFEPEWPFQRWMREGDGGNGQLDACLQTYSQLATDLIAFGVDRTDWLQRLAQDSRVVSVNAVSQSSVDAQAGSARPASAQTSFGMIRSGANAAYLGPVTAADVNSAEAVIRRLLQDVPGKVIWDMPSPNTAGVELCRKLGFQPVRNLLRMWTGRSLLCPDISMQFGFSDPGTG